MMKLRIPSRSMSNYSNLNRTISIHTLRSRHRTRFFISHPYFTRCKLRMTHTINPRKRSINILPIPISSYRPRNLLRIIPHIRNMNDWSITIYHYHSDSLYRICFTLRSNKILRCYSNHKPILSHSIYRKNLS